MTNVWLYGLGSQYRKNKDPSPTKKLSKTCLLERENMKDKCINWFSSKTDPFQDVELSESNQLSAKIPKLVSDVEKRLFKSLKQ